MTKYPKGDKRRMWTYARRLQTFFLAVQFSLFIEDLILQPRWAWVPFVFMMINLSLILTYTREINRANREVDWHKVREMEMEHWGQHFHDMLGNYIIAEVDGIANKLKGWE